PAYSLFPYTTLFRSLYRQHQRMAQMGITVSRASLTNWVKRAIELLRPIVEAQCRHVLLSKVLAMDETPIKAGMKHPGKMKQGYIDRKSTRLNSSHVK